MKFLVGLGPHMGLTFVSRMYGGRASDKHITLESEELIDNLRQVLLILLINIYTSNESHV